MSYLDVHDACKIVLLQPGNEGNPAELDRYNYNNYLSGGTADLTGGAGNVMLQVPKFYYKYSYSNNTHNYDISLVNKAGYAAHPWFYKNGAWVDYRYIGVYPATGWTTTFQDGDGTNSWFSTTTGKLGSIAGKKALSNFTRAQFRAAAARTGSGWSLVDFWGYAALKLLYVTKYGNLNSQSILGAGNTQFSSWNFATCISATGKVKSISATGQSTVGGNSGDYVNFLGIEDIFGGIWQFVDGWNINTGVNYISSNSSQFADDTTTNYALFGSTNPTSSGWQNTLQQNIGLLPATIGATSATKVTDYYYYNTGWKAPCVGGSADLGSSCGLFDLGAADSSSLADSYIGSRLCF